MPLCGAMIGAMNHCHRLFKTRSSGVLLHLSSLPGPWSCGDLGPAAYAFADQLAAMGQRWWQMLPVNPVGRGNSAYMTISSFAGEPRFISLDQLVRDGLLTAEELPARSDRLDGPVAYTKAGRLHARALRAALAGAPAQALLKGSPFRHYQRKQAAWLPDYALFRAIRDHLGEEEWTDWPAPLMRREPAALAQMRERLAEEIRYHQFCQFLFHRQWRALRRYCRQRGIRLMGDLPIFVAHASADVWAHPELFLLDRKLTPRYVAGAPPDRFNADGQRWGNALYNWDAMRREGFAWWIRRIEHLLAHFDAARLDHFIGYYQFWQVPARATTAREGRWVKAAGDDFFAALLARLGPLPLIAEDLGKVKPAVRSLRDKYGLFGMRVLQFAFDGDKESVVHRPHNYTAESVVYTGTHDNDTAIGWYRGLKRQAGQGSVQAAGMRQRAEDYLGVPTAQVNWQMIRFAHFSPARIAIIPLQDILGLGSGGRMNTPGQPLGCWTWRLPRRGLTPRLIAQMRAITEEADRLAVGAPGGRDAPPA